MKNMLQHSREGSGEHRPADINAIVDESLNLAYHGARAEKADSRLPWNAFLDPAARHGRRVSAGDNAGLAQFDIKWILRDDLNAEWKSVTALSRR